MASGRHRDADRVVLTPEARRIHESAIVIDGHNDLPGKISEEGSGSFDVLDISVPQKALHTDIPRLRRGGVGAQFWAAFVPPATSGAGGGARCALEQIDLIRRMVRRYPQTFELACTADDIVRVHESGRIASLIGVENGRAIENSLAVLRMLYALGARYMTLTHADTLDWVDSATDQARHGGLTDFGRRVVREMNELGMMVDISHVSIESMRDVLRVSTAPVIASHSSARALADHPRNVPDDVLGLLAANGGIIMVNFYSGFVAPEAVQIARTMFNVYRDLRAEQTDDAAVNKAMERWCAEHPIPAGTVHDVVDHIEHVIRVAGIDHVGVGSDFDGVTSVPAQLEDVSCYPCITQVLVDRGYGETDIHKVLGGNLLRVLRRVETVARESRS